MYTYTIQRHQPSGETYLLQWIGDEIQSVCGPLHHTDWSDDGGHTVRAGFDPTEAEYEPSESEWANAQQWGGPKDMPSSDDFITKGPICGDRS